MSRKKLRLSRLFAFPLLAVLAGCGGGGGGTNPPDDNDPPMSVDTEAPELAIDFPPPKSLVDQVSAPSLTVRGKASDDVALKAVRIEGVEVTSEDGFSSWQADVPLVPGTNTITVTAVDKAGNMASASVIVESASYLPRLLAAPVADLSGTGFLALDETRSKLVAVDESGTVEMLGDLSADPRIVRPLDMVRVADESLIVVDASTFEERRLSGIYRVDPENGDRVLISGNGKGEGPSFGRAYRLGLHRTDPGKVVVADFYGGIFEVDLETGERRLVSHADPDSNPDTDDAIGVGPDMVPRDVVHDVARDRLLVLTGRNVMAVDPGSGDRVVFAELPEITLDIAVLEEATGSLLLADNSNDATLWRVDLQTAEVSLVSGVHGETKEVRGAGPAMNSAWGVVAGSNGNLFLTGLQGVMEIDRQTGDRRLLPRPQAGSGQRFDLPHTVALDADNNRLLVGDTRREPLRILAIDLEDGNRSLVSEAGERGQGDTAESIDHLALSADGKTLWAAADAALLAIDVGSGDRRVVSDDETGEGPSFGNIVSGLTIDKAGNRAFVTTRTGSSDVTLLAVDLVDGSRTIVSGSGRGAGPAFGRVVDVAPGPDSARLFVIEWSAHEGEPRRLLSVDVATGDREVLAELAANTYAVIGSRDASGMYLYAENAILRFDPQSGEFDVVSGGNVLDGIRGRGFPEGGASWQGNEFAYDDGRNIFYVSANLPAAVLAVDAVSGDRVIVAL